MALSAASFIRCIPRIRTLLTVMRPRPDDDPLRWNTPVQIAAGTFPITFTDAVTGANVLTLDNVVLTANQTLTVYLIGSPGAVNGVVTQDN